MCTVKNVEFFLNFRVIGICLKKYVKFSPFRMKIQYTVRVPHHGWLDLERASNPDLEPDLNLNPHPDFNPDPEPDSSPDPDPDSNPNPNLDREPRIRSGSFSASMRIRIHDPSSFGTDVDCNTFSFLSQMIMAPNWIL
jgi:hypothetical protein